MPPDADRAELDIALRRAGIGEGRVEIVATVGGFRLRPRAYSADQAAGTRRTLTKLAAAYGNLTVGRGYVAAPPLA